MAKTPFGADRGTTTLQLDPDSIVIITDPAHPRFDHRALLPLSEDFIASLEGQGQIQAGTVTKNDDGEPELLDGRQRVLALREINRRRREAGQPIMLFTAIYRRVADDAEAVAIRHTANVHRPDPISVRAKDAEEFVRKFGWSSAKVAPMFGVGPKTIEQWVTVLECAPPVLAALDAGRLGLVAAVKLAALPRSKQAAELREMQDAKAPAVSSAARKTGKTKTGRPTASTMRKLAKHPDLAVIHHQARAALQFGAGQISAAAFAEVVPDLAKALGL